MSSYTVNQIAEIANVSNQAVYKRIRTSQIENDMFWEKSENGSTVIYEEGKDYLLDKFKDKVAEKRLSEKQASSVNKLSFVEIENKRLIKRLEEKEAELLEKKDEVLQYKEEMNKERGHSRELSNELMSLAKQITDLNKNSQVLLLQQSKQKEQEDIINTEYMQDAPNEERKPTWKERVFGVKKD